MKVFSLLELALLAPNQKTNEIDNLLIPYLKKIMVLIQQDVAQILRQMRNKIWAW